MEAQFKKNEEVRVSKLYQRKKHGPGFTSKGHLSSWFVEQLSIQDGKCHHCETSIFDIRKLINAKLLGVRKVRGEGVRGPSLEIDKKVNHLGYLPGNCVLACYYCNNDKSYTMAADEYKTFYGHGRHAHFMTMLQRMEKT